MDPVRSSWTVRSIRGVVSPVRLAAPRARSTHSDDDDEEDSIYEKKSCCVVC
jgi:hypothetical protein